MRSGGDDVQSGKNEEEATVVNNNTLALIVRGGKKKKTKKIRQSVSSMRAKPVTSHSSWSCWTQNVNEMHKMRQNK
jgi:hypothetical protein